jgi:hypothetical protein
MSFATFGNMAGLAQIWTLTGIAYDRAMAIFYPLRREKRMRHRQVMLNSYVLICHCCKADGE